MFLRFIQTRSVDGMAARQGFFDAAYDLRRSPTADAVSVARASRLLDWFDDHLDEPNRFNKTKSKGYWRKETRGLSWFKPTATDHISRSFEMAALLAENDIAVEVIKTRRPGFVVFEDDHQIVAEPFNDTPTG